MRGIHRLRLPAGESGRFIPAHAGNSGCQRRRRASMSVHPRACGEFARALRAAAGLRRFIPAHAGNSDSPAGSRSWSAVHPRACGEFATTGTDATCSHGSSPRMRGILKPRLLYPHQFRFIPAHAGNSTVCRRGSFLSTVHPRACGEFFDSDNKYLIYSGSSPRMRGIRDEQLAVKYCQRFIPAHAGNSATRPPRPLDSTVHPRACGEFRSISPGLHDRGGSSPRMRGIRLRCATAPRRSRFIPAHAGNSAGWPECIEVDPVHPRACGEFPRGTKVSLLIGGSSPRMRGIRIATGAVVVVVRFIPAHAGNSGPEKGTKR